MKLGRLLIISICVMLSFNVWSQSSLREEMEDQLVRNMAWIFAIEAMQDVNEAIGITGNDSKFLVLNSALATMYFARKGMKLSNRAIARIGSYHREFNEILSHMIEEKKNILRLRYEVGLDDRPPRRFKLFPAITERKVRRNIVNDVRGKKVAKKYERYFGSGFGPSPGQTRLVQEEKATVAKERRAEAARKRRAEAAKEKPTANKNTNARRRNNNKNTGTQTARKQQAAATNEKPAAKKNTNARRNNNKNTGTQTAKTTDASKNATTQVKPNSSIGAQTRSDVVPTKKQIQQALIEQERVERMKKLQALAYSEERFISFKHQLADHLGTRPGWLRRSMLKTIRGTGFVVTFATGVTAIGFIAFDSFLIFVDRTEDLEEWKQELQAEVNYIISQLYEGSGEFY